MLPEKVYKIVSVDEWDLACETGQFTGSQVDINDGYIHFSTASQLSETAQKHFFNRDDLILLTVETMSMARHYKMEPSRGGALFPHLYANMPLSSVMEWQELPLGENDAHEFPAEIFID